MNIIKFHTMSGETITANADDIRLWGNSHKYPHWIWWVLSLVVFWPWLIVLFLLRKECGDINVRETHYKSHMYSLDRYEYYRVVNLLNSRTEA